MSCLGSYFFKYNQYKSQFACHLELLKFPTQGQAKLISQFLKTLKKNNSIYSTINEENVDLKFDSELFFRNKLTLYLPSQWRSKELLQLSEKVCQLGFNEKYINHNVHAFYQRYWGRILLEDYFPMKIKKYLSSEFYCLSDILSQESFYSSIFEIACSDARNIRLAMKHNLGYYGIDLVEESIELAKLKISKNNLIKKSLVKCLSALSLSLRNTPVPESENPFCIFPFNSVGNIGNIPLLFKILDQLSYDFSFSIYKNSDNSVNARMEYYSQCGLSSIQVRRDQNGVIFTSDEGLKSIAYNINYLYSLIDLTKYQIFIHDIDEIGLLFYAKLNRNIMNE